MNIGADAGMGAWKMYAQAKQIEFLSQVATDGTQKNAATLGLRQSKRPLTIHTGGRSFYVGAKAHDWGRPIESLDYERLTGAPEMIALFYGAMTKLSNEFDNELDAVKLVVGLPFGSVKGDDGKHNIDLVKRWMEREHKWEADGTPYRVKVESVGIATQTTGALFDYLLDDKSQFIKERKPAFRGECGVVSIGFNTIELQTIRAKEEVHRFTAGSTEGVRRLLELSNPQGLYSLGELDIMLRTGRLDYAEALPVWERGITGFIEKTWGEQFKRFEVILLVGGGVKLLKNLQMKFGGKAYVPDNPVMSIARGLWKLGNLQ